MIAARLLLPVMPIRWGVTLAAALMFVAPQTVGARAAADEAASQFIDNLAQDVIATLKNQELSEIDREDAYRRLLHRGFAVQAIGRFVLGRYWRDATQAQRTEYIQVFEEYVIKAYASRLAQYAGVAMEITGSRDEGQKGAVVMTQIIRPEGRPIDVNWRVKNHNGEQKIVDVMIEGISMAVTQRSEFASVIRSNGGQVDGLLDVLRRKIELSQRPSG